MRPIRGLVAETLTTSFVDGPGNRFVVFLQGCTFDCVNCHNPQTIDVRNVHAGLVEVPQLVARIRDVAPFLSGVTVTGGEPTRQLDLLCELLGSVKADPDLAHLTTLVDSNGDLAATGWDRLAPWLDGAMIDVKAVSPEVHRTITGTGNDAVLASVRHLHELGRLHEIRLLVIPGLIDTADELERYAAFVRDVDPGLRLRLMAFRHHGVRAIGRRHPEATADDVAAVAARLRAAGLTGVVVPPPLVAAS